MDLIVDNQQIFPIYCRIGRWTYMYYPCSCCSKLVKLLLIITKLILVFPWKRSWKILFSWNFISCV